MINRHIVQAHLRIPRISSPCGVDFFLRRSPPAGLGEGAVTGLNNGNHLGCATETRVLEAARRSLGRSRSLRMMEPLRGR